MARINAFLGFAYIETSVVDGHWQIGGTNMVRRRRRGVVAQITLKGQHTQPVEGRWAVPLGTVVGLI